ncbi:MAG: TPM domain-containing protein [Deltaproteobacteria bacterium]|nr:TPM domain-containing protein [Deltaproteobacteria bacterium]
MKRIWLFLLVFLASSLVSAKVNLPAPSGFVNDFARVLKTETTSQLENILSAFERQSGIEIAVVTTPSLEEQPIEDYAVDLFKQWGIGKKGKDNGALFLIAPNERKTRIEVGYGLEGAINDALAGRLLDQVVVPRFKAGNIDEGIAAGTLAIVSRIAQSENIAFDLEAAASSMGVSSRSRGQKIPLPWPIKILIPIVMFYLFIRHPWLFLLFLGGGGRHGGGFSGGFGGFGGGMSGGGGASRGW